LEIVIWLQRSEWCEEVVLEQSSSCRSLGVNGTFGELKRQFHGALVPGCQWGLKSQGFLSSKSWYLVTKTRITSDALGAKTCLKDHYHKPLERDEVTLSAGYTASFRRAVVSLILAPERKTYEDTLALLDVSSERHAATFRLGSDGKTLPAGVLSSGPELIAPALVKRSHKKKVVPPGTKSTTTSRFPRSGPTQQNADGEEMPDQVPMAPADPESRNCS
jgi:hypothetical protein